MPRRDPGRRGGGRRVLAPERSTAEDDRTRLGDAAIGAAVVDCGLYESGRRLGGRIELETALEQASACRDGFVWIGLHDPAPPVVEAVGRHFELHPLAVEDAIHAHQRAKLETFGDSLFMVMKTARYVDHEELVEIGEVTVFLSRTFVVTVRHGEGSPLHEVREDLEAHPDLLGLGPSAVLYAVADRVVDDYTAVTEGIAVDIEEVEAEVFSGTGANPAERIYKLKREVLEFKRAVHPLQAPLRRLTDRQTGLPLDPRTGDYFRDIQDHLIRDGDRIQQFDDVLGGALQANLAQLTVRDNQDMRKISAWVAILAVPTMIFALYGMNFDYMPELRWRIGYPLTIAVIVVLCIYIYRRFRKSGWL